MVQCNVCWSHLTSRSFPWLQTVCFTSFHFLVYFFPNCLKRCTLYFYSFYHSPTSAFKLHKKRQKHLKKKIGMECFFLNLMPEVSCVELFNVTQPAAETQCDSCSLLKSCSRELFLGGSVCVCPTWHDDWWERGPIYEVFLLKWHARRFLKGQWRAGSQRHSQTCCPSQEALRWSLFFRYVLRYTLK